MSIKIGKISKMAIAGEDVKDGDRVERCRKMVVDIEGGNR